MVNNKNLNKREKFSFGNCDVLGLITGIKKELLNHYLDKLDVLWKTFNSLNETW